MLKRFLLPVIALLLFPMLLSSEAFAQDVRPNIEQGRVSYSEMELLRFAEAFQDVMQIIDKNQERLQVLPTGSAAESQLIDAITEEANKAIVEKGLAIDRFNQILRDFQTNPDVAVRVQSHLAGVQI